MSKTATYALIASTTGTGSSGTISFTSIPATYTDLIVVCAPRLTSGASNVFMEFNGDTATNYSTTILTGTGSAASSTRYTSATKAYVDYNAYADATNNENIIVHIMDYANTTTNKTIISRSNNAGTGVDANVSLWRKTPEAINQIRIYQANNFATSSTFKLYGIQAGNA
jgi:hypothetical protein